MPARWISARPAASSRACCSRDASHCASDRRCSASRRVDASFRSAGFSYHADSGAPTPPPSIGRSICSCGANSDHRTDCSSTRHKEGLRRLLAIGGFSMRLSAPVYSLKRQARLFYRARKASPLRPGSSTALRPMKASPIGACCVGQGRSPSTGACAARLFARLTPGDLVLVGARPGHGKTTVDEFSNVAVRSHEGPAVGAVFFTAGDIRRRMCLDRGFAPSGRSPAPIVQIGRCVEFDKFRCHQRRTTLFR